MTTAGRTVRVAALGFASIMGAVDYAHACSCADLLSRGDEALMARAQDVVRGKIISMRAGKDVQLRSGARQARMVAATMAIEAAVKGELSGEIEVVTGFGTGDCGIPGLFLASIAWDRPVELELHRVDTHEHTFSVHMCGYNKVLPKP